MIFFALILMLVFTLPTVCVALTGSIASASGNMRGGCHGNHGPMRLPKHSCCYAGHQVPGPARTAPSLVALNVVAGRIETPENTQPETGTALTLIGNAFSPPLATVLRI